jgi:hypothetical protein
MITILYTAGGLLFLRAALFALGKKTKKIFKFDTLENQQKLTGLIFVAASILCAIFNVKWFFYLGLIDLILTFLFYLQPTARTTKMILRIFLVINILFLAIIIYNYLR